MGISIESVNKLKLPDIAAGTFPLWSRHVKIDRNRKREDAELDSATFELGNLQKE